MGKTIHSHPALSSQKKRKHTTPEKFNEISTPPAQKQQKT